MPSYRVTSTLLSAAEALVTATEPVVKTVMAEGTPAMILVLILLVFFIMFIPFEFVVVVIFAFFILFGIWDFVLP